MEALTAIVDIVGKVVTGVGLFFFIMGGYHFFDGYKSENSPDQIKGGKELVAGGGIFLIGTQVVPMLASIFA